MVMSKGLKFLIILIVVIAASGIWWWHSVSQKPQASVSKNIQQIQNVQTSQVDAVLELTTSPQDNSDAALRSDLSAIDSQIKGLNSDFALIDQDLRAATAPASARVSTTSIATIIGTADNEINQKVKNLNDLILRIISAKKLSTLEKNSLSGIAQNQLDTLEVLRSTIDAEASRPKAVADYQLITKSYPIYDLLLSQGRTVIFIDSVLTVVDSMDTVGIKVQSRLTNLTGVGASTIQQIFSDFAVKVSDANSQAQSALIMVSNSKPNTTTLSGARVKIKTATDDLISARKDIGIIITDLREMSPLSSPEQ
jgi:flagellar basal body-associated protein FliL